MKNLPKPNQLKVFQSIIEHGSFRAAAKALHQTQPALTQSMNELEKMLGTPLLMRGPRGVVLTEAGKLFEPRVQLVLKELERAVNEAKQLSATSQGTIELGSSSLPFFTMLPAAIQRFNKRFPQVNINLTEGQISELLPALRGGELDFVIGATSPETILASEFIEEPFFTTPFAVVAHRDHPLAKSTSLNQLKQAKWYLPTAKIGYFGELDALLFPEGGENTQTIIRGDTAAITLQMVMNAGFLTVAAKEMLRVPYLSQQLCIIPIEEQLPDASYSFIYSHRLPLTMHARTMIDKLQRECKIYPWSNEVD
ncbi:LysR substrate-binding domain-containing protein [Serratia fonticola]|uniref:LysR substrate-binding domain-containing protein n=1 Tax=Serratia fonticola TaxID=47917 RepID=UPI002179E719|nr:LysR substrate-binding domain-containing protein [Serratia fonticola]CAI1599081.1 HTH-type transcriptional regulator AbgR [Serratia fonticola]CAI1674502.1 HTH-type transcriptional regulator AbgR [Serratia fonticola]CAI1682292.1 HTH-type transcriptional regulator AbgR [Serratia fonticola]CAI1913622.1 HTH-type transcriptional regulator AbgR [Serratia fonticola]CAI2009469.1 HTH-type transcriptional regulator AbgR [Serratia fonticola]